MPATKELPPVLQYLKDNAVIVGILAVLALSIGYFAFTQAAADAREPAPQPTAPEVTAAPLETVAGGPAEPVKPSASATPSADATNPARGADPVVGSPSGAGATAAPEFVAGAAQQAVTASPWKPVAEAFAAAWADPAGGKDAWVAALAPYATKSLADTFPYTDIRNIPADKLKSISTVQQTAGTVSFTAAYEDGGIRFQALATLQPDGKWLVDKLGAPEKK